MRRPDNNNRREKKSFRSIIIRGYILLVIVPFLAAVAVFYFTYRWNFQNTYGENVQELLDSQQQRLDGIAESVEDESMFLYYENFFDDLGGTELTEETENLIQESMEYEVNISTNIVEMVLIYQDQAITAGKYYYDIENTVKQFNSELEKNEGRPVWLTTMYLLPVNLSGYKMILGRALNSKSEKGIAYLYLIIDTKIMDGIINQSDSETRETILIGEDGTILNATKKDRIGAKMEPSDLGISDTEKHGFFMGSVNEKALIVYSKSYQTNWILVEIIPIREIMSGFSSIQLMLLLVAVVYLLFLWIMLRLIEHRLLNPMTRLAGIMDAFAAGDMNVRADPDEPYELGRLNRHFNQMTEHIKQLIEENNRESAEKNNFKMRALTAQLSPHFIYNALNTIKWMAVINRQDNIREITEALIRLLMNAAKSGEDYYTVQDEINVIESYIVIQKVRFMNFDVTWDVQEDARSCRIRRFLVQPVVENAIVHGFGRGKMHGGRISIRIYTDQFLHIEVEDNGCGFDASQLDRKTDTKENNPDSGIALYNIRQIISIDYGSPFGLDIQSSPGKGTKAVYLLPVIRESSKQTEQTSSDGEGKEEH